MEGQDGRYASSEEGKGSRRSPRFYVELSTDDRLQDADVVGADVLVRHHEGATTFLLRMYENKAGEHMVVMNYYGDIPEKFCLPFDELMQALRSAAQRLGWVLDH